jgi:ribonuclease BN (tRNA processing enzyme)
VTFTVTVLGCNGSFPGPGGACSGYLLACDDTRVWLDCGSGTLANLQRHVAMEDVTAVVISHQHPDHWTDLEHFGVACRWALGRTGVPVYAPGGLRELTRIGSAADVFDWHDMVDGDQVTIGALRLSFSQTDHPVTTLAARIEGAGRSLGYSADSGPAWELASLGSGLDAALCEATFLSDREGSVQHLSARQAGRTACDAGANRLIITHLTPGVDPEAARAEAASAYGGDVAVAAIGARFEI